MIFYDFPGIQKGGIMDSEGQIARASEITGKTVVNRKGEQLGVIEELVADSIDGRIAYVVLSFVKIRAMQKKLVAIPWESLTETSEDRYVLDLDRDTLLNAPGLDGHYWPPPDDRQWMQKVYSYYHREPYWI